MRFFALACGVAAVCGLPARNALAQDALFPTTPLSEPSAGDPTPRGAIEPNAQVAAEPPSARFAARGEVLISGGTSLGLSGTTFDSSDASRFSAFFSLGLDYFFLNNLSIGVDTTVSYASAKGYGADSSLVGVTTTGVSAGPRIGFNVPLSKRVSWYPRLAVGFESVHQAERLVSGRSLSIAASAIGTDHTTQTGPWVSASAPLLFHPVAHFFVGAGPTAFHAFSRAQQGPEIGGQRTSIGVSVLVGGYWGGTPDAPDAETTPPAVAPPAPRFGQAHQIVISNELGAGASSTMRVGTDSSTTQAHLSPALDYFVVNHISLGVVASLSYSAASGVDAITQETVRSTTSALSFGARAGFELPIAPWLSFYPRVSLSYGIGKYDQKSAGNANVNSYHFVAVGAYAPLVVYPASHLFLGFGPSISRELDRTYGPRDLQNRSTTLGAGFVVGGWL